MPRPKRDNSPAANNAAGLVTVRMLTGLAGKDFTINAGALVQMEADKAKVFISERFARPATQEELKEKAIQY